MFTVFLVDDEPAVVKAMSRLLRTKGYGRRSIYIAAGLSRQPRSRSTWLRNI
jgi:FixJ family two-component response regulator